MSRAIIAASVVMITVACADPDAITSPKSSGFGGADLNVVPCTAEQGQQLINAGQYVPAIQKFTCVLGFDPTSVEGYRGRIEAQLMLGRYSDALQDYTRVTAFVLPMHPDAEQVIIGGYKTRLAAAPGAIPALTGLSFAYWYFFDYPAARHVLDALLAVQSDDVYGNLFRGSSRVLQGAQRAAGAADLEQAIALAPSSPDVHFIVADAYTYGYLPDPQRAFAEATLALGGGLDTPRVRAILAASYLAFGNMPAAAMEIDAHLDLVTTQLVATSPLAPGSSMTLAMIPGRTYEIPITVAAGETVTLTTSSKDFVDTILALYAPAGAPVFGSDDYKGYFAGFAWVAPSSGTYRVRVTSFEGVSTGELVVVRK